MAHYAAVASVVQLLDDILHNNNLTEFLAPGQEMIIKSAFQKFNSLLDFLRNYSSRSGHEEAAAAGRRIRDVAYRAQEILLQESNISNQISRWDEDLVKLGEQLDSAVEDLKKTQTDEEDSHWSPLSSPTKSMLRAVPVVGLDHQFIKIANQLCSYSSKLEVISIVGMVGIGKTFLARHIFQSQSIDDQFMARAWVTVSQNCDVNQVLSGLLHSLSSVYYYHGEGETAGLQERVYRLLKGRRYLIVVDDLWNTEVWDYLRRIFPNDYNGSRIVCTTQCNDVADYVASNGFVHEIPFLDEDDSWILLKQMVFLNEFYCPPELEIVGRLVATKCGGLPLAIAQVAQILSSNAGTPEHWEHVAVNVNTILGADDGGILFNALSRSYDQLTDRLKACFLYLGSFPNDCEISVSKLVKLWVAELIVKSRNRTLEQEAQKCLEVLNQRNLVHIIKKTTTGRIKFSKLHDLVRSFCRRKACDENFLHATQDEKGCLSKQEIDTIAFDRCKLWRVLDIVEKTPWLVLNTVVQMFHLKYLRLQLECRNPRLGLPPLPPSISMLQKLQTLIIHHPKPYYVTLPPQIWKMTKLRHVIVTVMTLLPPTSTVSDTLVSKLEYLKTLLTLKDFIFTGEVIEMIPNIRKLKISYTGIDGNGKYVFYDHLDNLVHLQQLDELTIMVDPVPVFGLDSIWSDFTFPWRLTKLSIGGCRLPWEEMTMISSLPNLQILKLKEDSFVGEKWEQNEGEFLTLKFLLLEMLDLKYWLGGFPTCFPCLEHLKIMCTDLENIPSEIGDIPTLRLIEVYAGSESILHSAQIIKEEQEDLGNEDLKVVIKNSYS